MNKVSEKQPEVSYVDDFEVEGKSLWALLERLDFLDNQEELQEEGCKQVMEAVKDKSDAYKWVDLKYKQEILRMDGIAKAFQAKKTALQNGQARFKRRVAEVLDASVPCEPGKKPVLVGNLFKIHRTSNNKCVPMVEANVFQAVNLPEYINVSYKWRIDEIKKQLGKDERLNGVAKLVPTQSVIFTENTKKKGV